MTAKLHICKRCGFTNDGTGFHGKLCVTCRKIQRNSHYEENKNRLIGAQKEYYQDNKEEVKIQKREYYQLNKEVILQNHKEYERERLQNDPVYSLRKQASTLIRQGLKKQNSSKFGESIVRYLSYSFAELKEHLENQFEPWMNWENQGKYNPQKWNDDDSTTWTWQLDHIVPQADLPYTSMEDKNFKKCWALNNLRPLNSKQNLLDGALRTRHGGIK